VKSGGDEEGCAWEVEVAFGSLSSTRESRGWLRCPLTNKRSVQRSAFGGLSPVVRSWFDVVRSKPKKKIDPVAGFACFDHTSAHQTTDIQHDGQW